VLLRTTSRLSSIARHMDQFGDLTHTTEFWLFGLPLGAVAAGWFEMMTRERAGIPRDRQLMHTNKRTETGPGAGNERPIGP
jgi:hypothetical protein